LAVAAFIYLYEGQPLAEPWNTHLVNLIVSLAAISSAVAATLNWRRFPPADRGPRVVWANMALALWLWAAGETIYFIYILVGAEPPLLSIADIPWMIGYVFFASALIHQYRLVYRSSRAQETYITLGVTGGILIIGIALTAVLMQLAVSEQTWLETLVSVLYPLLDLAVGLAALWLIRAFGGGLWGRPWVGLFIFALADSLYAWLQVTGLYDAFVSTGNPLSLVADTVYLIAYLVMAIACLSLWLLLQYGPPPTAAPEPALPEPPGQAPTA
jgi:hypothetical protein